MRNPEENPKTEVKSMWHFLNGKWQAYLNINKQM